MNVRKPVIKPVALVFAGIVAGALFSELMHPAAAMAQDGKLPPDKILNSAEWTKQMNTNLQQINDRIVHLEATINSGIKVKVTEMPAVQLKDK